MGPNDFKTALYGDADTGWLTVFYTPTRRTVWFPVSGDMPKLDPQQNCYLGLGIRGKKTQGRGKAEDIIAVPGLWLDLDFESPGAHKATHPLPPNETEALALLEIVPHQPTLVIHSGHGIQAYWLFNEPIYFDADMPQDHMARLCVGWQHVFQDAGKQRGWHVDSTADLPRVFRIPGSKNIKTKPHRDVTVFALNETRYEPSDFADYIAPEQTTHKNSIDRPVNNTQRESNNNFNINSLHISDRIKYLILHGDTIKRYPSRSEAVFAAINGLIGAGCSDDEIAQICLLDIHGISALPREKGERWIRQEIARTHQKHQGKLPTALPVPQSGTDLLGKDIPPPLSIIDGMMHEGMLLFGGKSKRGKSWLMLDLAMSVATGGSAFRHFFSSAPAPVLYLALEDGQARIQRRLRAIQPNIQSLDNLHLLYDFPSLSDGGIDRLAAYIQRYQYRLIIIDVLAKVEPPTRNGKDEKSYHDIYAMFAPLQDLRHTYPFCLAMLTHLRKQDAEDVFDTLHGSVAYQGAQDVLWILERKPKDDVAFLHIRDKDAEDKTLCLRFDDGHWEYIGEGEAFDLARTQREILSVLQEEGRPLSIAELLKAMGLQQSKYEAIRKALQRMSKEDLIIRTDRGRYAASLRALEEEIDF